MESGSLGTITLDLNFGCLGKISTSGFGGSWDLIVLC